MSRRSNRNWKKRLPKEVIETVIQNANGRCEWCMSIDHCGIDHIIPKGQGGPHKLWNFQYLCDRCGNWKAFSLPGDVLWRIKRMRSSGVWSARVKSNGHRIMSEFIENGYRRKVDGMESSEEPLSEPVEVTQSFAVFPNPLEVNLGEGRIAMSAFGDKTETGNAYGIVLQFNDTAHEIGEQGPKLTDGGPREGQVYIRCLNIQSARALAMVVNRVVQKFEAEEYERVETQMVGIAMDENSSTDERERALNTLSDLPQSQG
jgi:hypothetical protein